MKIIVFGELAIQKYLTEENHILISIQDPTCDFVSLPDQKSRLDTLQLHFYDLDRDDPAFLGGYIFTIQNAKDILDFVNTWKDKIDLILVNCVAGISRSAGVAAALSKILNGNDSFYFRHYLPNSLVYRTILKEYYDRKTNE